MSEQLSFDELFRRTTRLMDEDDQEQTALLSTIRAMLSEAAEWIELYEISPSIDSATRAYCGMTILNRANEYLAPIIADL